MGPVLQRFWLSNNLIAQIPGDGGAAGKAYSVEWALHGHGVLLHPEGQVGWHADTIGPLFPGVVDMALEALRCARECSSPRDVYLCPVIWRLRFLTDVDDALAREMSYVERKLGLRGRPGADVAQRMHEAYLALLERDAAAVGMTHVAEDYRERQLHVLRHLADRLCELIAALGVDAPRDAALDAFEGCRALLRPADRLLRSSEAEATSERDELRRVVKIARRLLRFSPRLYPQPELTQEQVAENIKRLRADYCFGSLRDALCRLAPRPVGPRRVLIRIPQPLRLNAVVAAGREADEPMRSELLALLSATMQECLDELGRHVQGTAAARPYPNPFAGNVR
jgi:hypothetical protein